MKCPHCEFEETKVVETRCSEESSKVRRRRLCEQCSYRFTTYEFVEYAPVMIVKRDQSRERFDRKKVYTGLLKACEKRPVPMQELENIVQEIETSVQSSLEREVSSSYIGELCMEFLRNLDEIAYIRFASVYKEFKDLNEFMHELKNFINEKEDF